MKRFFVDNYKKCWEFGKESKWFFVFAFGLFSLMFLIGFAFPVFFREEIFTMIQELILSLEGLGAWDLSLFIFLNNMQASFFAMVFGIVLGIFPIASIVLNGYLLGFVSREAVMADGILTMWRILPHGIFELPAVLFSIGIGLKIGSSAVGWFNAGKLKYNFKEGLRFFAFVVFPLLLVAGIIEGMLIAFMS